MSNDEYRAEQAERRRHGLKARHEQRLENATYTAAEVKVLTEKAGEFGYRLGRKEAGEEIAEAIEVKRIMDGRKEPEMYYAGRYSAFDASERIAREIGSQPSPDATSGRTDPEEPK